MRATPVLLCVSFVASLATSRVAVAGPCVITAKHASLTDVRVHAGGKTLTLALSKVPLALDLQSESVATLRVRGPLRFVAVGHTMSRVPLRLARRQRLFGGRVVLAPKLKTKLLALHGSRVGVEVALDGLHFRQPLVVPCRALTVPAKSPGGSPFLKIYPGKRDLAFTTGFVPLYRRPGVGAPLQIKLSYAPRVTAQQPGWVHIEAHWGDGSSVQGWVPSKHVEVRTAEMLAPGGLGYGTIGGLCGSSHRPRLVPLTLRRNARIAVSPGGAVWARAAARVPVKTFVMSRSDGWLQIARIEHLPTKSSCSYHDKMWVHVKDIVWTKKAP